MTNPNTRLAVDLDDFERQLRQGKGNPDPARGDPLAELARIVGQEDPFRAVLGTEDLAPAPPPVRAQAAMRPPAARAASVEAASRHEPAQAHAQARPPYGDPGAGFPPADEGAYGQRDDLYAEPTAEQRLAPRELALEPHDPRRPRKGLMAVGAVLGVAVLGVAGAVALRGGGSGQNAAGGPPIIQADRSPSKVQPQNPGGAEIPDQNKQIYDRRAPQEQTRVVNREEQPVDVQQAVRSAAGRAGADATASLPSTATPGSGTGPSTLTASLGEPRRVRTVSVKPDLAGPSQEAQRQAQAPGGAAASSATTPAVPAPATPSAPPPTPRARPDAPTTASPQPGPAASTTPAPALAPKPSTRSAAAPAPENTVSATSEDPRAAPAAQRTAALGSPAAPAEKAATGGGGYAVQLAVRPSDKEARQAYKELQQKFGGDLEGRSPLIKQAEVNGKTVFRIRVGPLAREEANSLCTKLKSSGGQCFVAKD